MVDVDDIGVTPRRQHVGVEIGLLDIAGFEQRVGADRLAERRLGDGDGLGIPDILLAKNRRWFFRQSAENLGCGFAASLSRTVRQHAPERAHMVGNTDQNIRPELRIRHRPVNQIEQPSFHSRTPACLRVHLMSKSTPSG